MSPSPVSSSPSSSSKISPSGAMNTSSSPSPQNIAIFLNWESVTCVMVMLWILCVYFNRIILHKTQHCYSTKSVYFRTLIEFVATIDVIFSTIFMVYFVASLTPGLLHGNGSQSPNRMCYELNKSVGEWFFNVVFTAGLVAMLRQSLLSMLYRKHKKCSQSPKGNLKTIASHLFTVNTWRNSWTLALLFLLLIGPWVATSAVMDSLPEAGPPKEICIYSTASWTILLPVTICVTVVSILLASGWSTYVTYALKTVTSCGCCGNDSDSGDAFPGFFESLQNNNKISGNNMSKNVDDAVETNNKKIEEMSISVQLVMFFIVLLGLIMFIVLIVYGNLYSDTSQIVRAQMAITLTSLFQMVVFHCLQDSASSTRTFSVNSGDVVSV